MKTIVYSVLSLLAGCGIGCYLTTNRLPSTHTPLTVNDTIRLSRTDTVTVRDTVRVNVPVPIERRISPGNTITIPSSKLLGRTEAGDSVTARAVTHIYSDSTFRAVISGVDPRLDSLTIYPPRTLISSTTASLIRASTPTPVSSAAGPPSRWNLGITAGLTATPHSLSPGLTIGLTYRLWP